MIRIQAYGTERELLLLKEMLTNLSIQYEKLEYELKLFVTLEAWEGASAQADLVDLLICDVSEKAAVQMLIAERKQHREAKIIPIADETILPSVYVRPEIFPCALLWRPLENEKNKNTLLQILQSFQEQEEKEQIFYITTRQKTQAVPYQKILYFESRDKRVYVRTEFEEIGFHGTLSGLETELQENFIRCHKGYLVNKKKIQSVDWVQHLLKIGENCLIPISRNYQGKIREVYHERNHG